MARQHNLQTPKKSLAKMKFLKKASRRLTKTIMRRNEEKKQRRILNVKLLRRVICMRFLNYKTKPMRLERQTSARLTKNSLLNSTPISWATKSQNKTRKCGLRFKMRMRRFQTQSNVNDMTQLCHSMMLFQSKAIGQKKHSSKSSKQCSIVMRCLPKRNPSQTQVIQTHQ